MLPETAARLVIALAEFGTALVNSAPKHIHEKNWERWDRLLTGVEGAIGLLTAVQASRLRATVRTLRAQIQTLRSELHRTRGELVGPTRRDPRPPRPRKGVRPVTRRGAKKARA